MTAAPGVPAPNYTQVPNDLLDRMSELTPAEFKIAMAIARLTFGWHKTTDKISISQLIELTGLSRPGVINTCAALLDRGWITRTPDPNDRRGGYVYRLVVRPPEANQSTELTGQPDEPVNSVDQQPVNSVNPPKKEKKISGGGGGSAPARARKAQPPATSHQPEHTPEPATAPPTTPASSPEPPPGSAPPPPLVAALVAPPRRLYPANARRIAARAAEMGIPDAQVLAACDTHLAETAGNRRLVTWRLEQGHFDPAAPPPPEPSRTGEFQARPDIAAPPLRAGTAPPPRSNRHAASDAAISDYAKRRRAEILAAAQGEETP